MKFKKFLLGAVASAMLAGALSATASAEAGDVDINKKNFPDENFRQYVLDKCDQNEDGSLSKKEINSVVNIDVSFKFIGSLKGIEYFVNLEELYCYINKLTSLDVSKNTALTHLNCGGNKLTSLDVSKNTALIRLSCGDNQLTSLDVSKNTALKLLYCDSNKLASLDVSKNTKLDTLACRRNKLSVLDLNNNPLIVKAFDYEDSAGLLTDEDITIYGKSGSFAEEYAKENDIKFVAGKAPVGKPTGLTAKSGNKQITLKWDAVSGATKYRVQWKTSDGWKTIARPKTNSYKHKGLKNGSTYTYRVSAYVDGKWGKYSARLKAKAGV